ncbi:MAG: ABC transporter permease [Spirochaetaceae bacterium]|jgi:putative ABC transport system permease protein|nr:ABC transporter permease [Spirochaetaceae bacterium]
MNTTAPLTLFEMARTNLYERPFRSLCIFTLVALMGFVLFGGSLVGMSLLKGVDSMAKRLGADLLIVPRGYDQTIEGILLRSEPGAFYMDEAWVPKIAAIQGVHAVSPQLFITSLNASCCAMPVQLIGFEGATDFVVGPWIQTALKRRLSDGEIVIGSSISGPVGSSITFFNREYRVVGRLDRTGMGFDASVFMNMESARQAAQDYQTQGGPFPPPGQSVSSILVATASDYTPRNVYDRIQQTFDYGNSGIVPVLSKNIIHTIAQGLRSLMLFIIILAVMLWIGALLIVSLLFSLTLGERVQEFALFRVLGITKKRLMLLILTESALVSLAGGLAGALGALLILVPFRTLISETLGMPYVLPSPGAWVLILTLSLCLSGIIGPLASLYPAVKMSRMEVYAAVRRNGL